MTQKFYYYYLEEKHPVGTVDIREWTEWFESADRVVKTDKIGDITVSTVFLGMNHQFGDGPPILFETMVFGGVHDQECHRYSTWDEAEKGHDEVLKSITTPTNLLEEIKDFVNRFLES